MTHKYGQMLTMIAQNRYETLDGLRGVAAIGVMFFHLSIIGLPIAYHGYLAVDFFFMLSGFVMSHAYETKLSSVRFSTFLTLRLIRIFPLSVFGLLLGSLYFLLRNVSQNSSAYSYGDILLGTGFNIFLLPKPWMTPAPTDTIFPSNTPLLSLSLEMLINFVWALYFFRARSTTLMSIIVVSGSAFVYFTINHHTADIGATWPTYLGGLSRAVFGFFAGSMIWRSRVQPDKPSLYAVLPFLVLVGIIFAPDLGPFFDVVVVVTVFPAIIFIASCTGHRSKIGAFNFLGNISFPLYVVHVPLLMFSAGLTKFFDFSEHINIVSMVTVLTCILSSVFLDKYYDRKMRRVLTRKVFEEGHA